MYSKARIVPSKAALRILYRLAYIGSGTAAGFATLCAEERRRRTNVVQKIADNARRLRQSPRYYQNVAASNDPTKSSFFHDHVSEEGKQSRGYSPDEGPCAKSNVLPSVVARDYARLADPVSSGWPGRHARFNARQNRFGGIYADDIAKGVKPDVARLQDQTRKEHELNDYEITVYRQHLATFANQKAHLPTGKGPPGNLDPSQTMGPEPKKPDSVGGARVSGDLLGKKVSRFWRKTSMAPYDNKTVLLELANEADALIREARSTSSVHLMEGLITWKMTKAGFIFTSAQITQLCDDAASFLLSNDAKVVLDLYHRLLFRNLFVGKRRTRRKIEESVTRKDRSVLALQVFCTAVQETALDVETLAGSLWKDVVSDQEAMSDLLKVTCRQLAHDGHVRAAISTYLAIKDADILQEDFNAMGRHLFHASLQAQMLPSAVHVLRRMESRKGSDPNIQSELSKLLEACDKAQEYALVHSTFVQPHQRLQSATLNLRTEAHKIIAAARVKGGRRPKPAREALDTRPSHLYPNAEARVQSSGRPKNLREEWRRTQNLDLTRHEYENQLSRLEGLNQTKAVTNLHIAMSEVYMSAGDIQTALATLRKVTDEHADAEHRATFVAASIIAKGAHPKFLLQYLDGAHALGRLVFNKSNDRLFNGIIKVLGKRLTLSSFLRFIVKAVDTYGFVPRYEATAAVIRASVWQKNLEFLIPWYKFLLSRRLPLTVNSDMAREALRELHRSQKPPAHQLLGMIVRLLRAAPRLADKKSYVSLFEEAIAWHKSDTPDHNRQETMHYLSGLVSELERYTEYTKSTKSTDSMKGWSRLKLDYSPQERSLIDMQHWVTLQSPGPELQLLAEQKDVPVEVVADSFMGSEHGPEQAMLHHFALREYSQLLDKYRESVTEEGLPPSLFALQLAVTASLELHRSSGPAKALLAEARAAGFDITAASDPVALHELETATDEHFRNSARIRALVVEHYQTYAKSRRKTTPHVANQAAYLMISRGRSADGLNLLRSIFDSNLPDKPLPDMATMLIYFEGYADQRHWEGVQWVVETVLNDHMTISRKFIRVFTEYDNEIRASLGEENPLSRRMRRWRTRLRDRKWQQMHDSQQFGHELIQRLLGMAGMMDKIEDDDAKALEPALDVFGKEKYCPSVPRQDEAFKGKGYRRLVIDPQPYKPKSRTQQAQPRLTRWTFV